MSRQTISIVFRPFRCWTLSYIKYTYLYLNFSRKYTQNIWSTINHTLTLIVTHASGNLTTTDEKALRRLISHRTLHTVVALLRKSHHLFHYVWCLRKKAQSIASLTSVHQRVLDRYTQSTDIPREPFHI